MAKQIDWLDGENTSSIIDVTPQYETPGEDSFNNSLEKSQQENGILKRELKELKQSREEMNEEIEKLKRKVDRKKNELKIEKSITNTFSQLIEELNRKIEELKNAKVPDKTIQGKTNIQSPILNEEMIEKIVLEKTGLESKLREQIEEIKSLNSQINLTKEQFEIISIEKTTQQKETEERLQQELDKLKREEMFQNKEQEKQIIDLKTSLEQSGREIIEKERHIQEIEGVKLRIETDLNRVRRELKEKTESSETYKSKIEQLTKANSEFEMSVQISNEKNKKYKQEHSKVTLELQETNTKHLEMQQILERTILEANKSGNESKQKQETDFKAMKDQIQLLTQQNNEHRKTKAQCKHELLIMDGVNQENKQAREELEVKLKGQNEELEQLKSDYEDLNHELQKAREVLEGKKNEFEVITKDKGNMRDKYFQMEKEKQDLQEQIEGLHTLINTLKQNTGDVKFKLDEVEKEKDKNKTEKNKFEKQLTDERIQKEEGRNSIEKLEIELKGERESLHIHKQLIRKLNEDIKNQPTCQTIIKVREELEQANEFRSTFEDKLREMSKEIADRDAQIQQLYKKIGNIQVDTHLHESDIPQSDSDLNLYRNLFQVQSEKEKGQAKVGVTKISADKPQSAEGGNQITPIPNLAGRSAIKIKYRGVNISVVKLKALPDPMKHERKQIICIVRRNYELGTLVDIFDVQVKVGKKTQISKYVGIRLNEPFGDCNGAFQGVQHFMCEPNHGYFSPFEDVYVPVV